MLAKRGLTCEHAPTEPGLGRSALTERQARKEARRAKGAPRSLTGSWMSAWPVLIPVVLAVWTYHGALRGGFVFDDMPAVKDNYLLESVGGFWEAAFGEKHSPISNRPLVCLTFSLNYAWSGLDAFGYHVVNLAIHCANAMLLWGVLRRTLIAPNLGEAFDESRATWTATAVAAVWTVHPLATEAVVYITQRTTLVMSFFLLLMLYGPLRAASSEDRRRSWLIVTVASCAAAILSKEEAAAAPILLVLFDRALLFDSFRNAWEKRAAVYGSAAATWLLLIACVAAGPTNPTVGYDSVPRVNAFEWLLTEAPVLVHYLRLTLWPHPLIAAYDWDVIRKVDEAFLPGLLILALLIASFAVWFRRPHWGFLGAWFFLLLAPTSSIMPIISEIVAERRMYLPMLSVLVPVILGVLWIVEQMLRATVGSMRAPTAWAALPLAVVVFFASSATAEYARVFDDEKKLWTDVFEKNPLTNGGFLAGSLLNGYAKVLLEERKHDVAVPLLRRAVACEPPHNDAFVNLAAALVDLGPAHYAEAEKLYQEALAREPDHPNCLSNYAKLKLDQFQLDPPDKRLGPNDPRMQQAYAMLQQAIEIDPRNVNYLNNLGSVSFHLGRIQEAEAAWTRALQIDPNNVGVASNRAIVLAHTGRRNEAAAQFEELLKRFPGNVAVLINLASVYIEMGNHQAALQRVRQALEVDPNNAAAGQLLQLLTKPGG